MRYRLSLFVGAAALFSLDAAAQTADTAPAEDVAGEEIVVTAVARGVNRLETSISVSTINAETIQNTAPRSVAELFRQLPGIRSESSGGEGNANIAVRGLPVASGGAKFLQLQEDGLPILEFGDIAFGNADIFLRSDINIARVESVRGGSASTFASNAPGGVINLISKDGSTEGGTIQGLFGLNYGEYRVDADYGAKLSETLKFHIGGFYRQGEGPRRAGYDGNSGGQIKANITKTLDRGYIRLNFKYLDDKAIAYLPSPVRVTGSNGDPRYRSIPGLDSNSETIHSAFFTQALTLNGDNNRELSDIREGQRPLVISGGFETELDVGWGVTFTDRFKYSSISGRFISPFPATVDSAQSLANAIGGPGSSLAFATGPNAGQAIAAPGALNGNGLAIGIVLFNTRLNSLNDIVNDARLSKDFDVGGGKLSLQAGFYKAKQTIDVDWLWTSHLLEVNGDNAALLDVRNAAGQLVTDRGTVAYGASFFGNCCRRNYNVDYNIDAPFFSAGFEIGKLNLDASVRYDHVSVRGTTLGDGPVVSFDVNGDGTISRPEQQTTILPLASSDAVNYDIDYVSYSLGANYRLRTDLALFARYSQGGRANAERILLNPNNVDPRSGRLVNRAAAADFVEQVEGGVKFRQGPVSLYATGFYAKTSETNFEATTQRLFSREYEAKGVEVEGSYAWRGFSVYGTATYTTSEITRDNITPANSGNTPRRQAEFIYAVTPQYATGLFTAGVNVTGTTDSFTQDSNLLKLPGFTQVNAFLTVRPMERIQLGINANNVFDVAGYTEAEEEAIPANGIVRARSINGRTISASVQFRF